MAQNYTRQSSFADGDTISASLFNDEYNQLVNTFNYSSTDSAATGHRHDGTAGQGGNIFKIGDLDFLNKIEADSSNNRWGFWVEVSSVAVEQLRIQDGALVPVTDNDIDLGTSSVEFKNLYLDGTAKVDTLVVDETATITGAATLSSTLGVTGATTLSSTLGVTGATTLSSTLAVTGAATLSSTLGVTGAATLSSDLTVAGNTVLNGNTTIGNAATDTVTITADVSSNLIPSADSTYTLGDSSNYWSAGYIDALTTTGNVSVGGNLTVTGNATISGNLTFGDADTDTVSFSADVVSDILPDVTGTYDLGSATKQWQDLFIDGTANIDSLVADTADINGGTIDGAIIGGSSAAAGTFTTATATTGNITTVNATTVDTTNIEVTNLKAKDGTSAGSIADSTGVVTLASSVLTTTDINGGTIDGAVIGGSSAAAGSFTTLGASGAATLSSTLALTGAATLSSTLTVAGTTTLNGNVVVGDAATDTLTVTADIASNLIPSVDSTYALGDSSNYWSNLYVDAGTVQGVLTFGSLSDGTITVTGFVDEDDMASNSATLVPTQQSVKNYTDTTASNNAVALAIALG